MIRIIIVDDDAIVVRSLATILSADPDIQVVGTGTTAADGVGLYEREFPDVALLDIQMPEADGLLAAEQILAAHPDATVVFLTTFSDDDYIVRALRLGAAGYLIKQDVSTIAPALHAVAAGQRVLEGEVLSRAISLARVGGGDKQGADAPQARPTFLNGLTEREQDVVMAVADGLNNAEVAGLLHMSEGTVRNHISSVLAKLGLRNRTQLAVHYWRKLRT